MSITAPAAATPAPWYETMRAWVAKGRTVENVGGLAGLAQARQAHEGQFFTPPEVVRFMWSLIDPSLEAWGQQVERKIAIVDTACGSGRMFEGADRRRHELHGCDIDGPLMNVLAQALRADRFPAEIQTGRMEELRFQGMADVALLNPPFGLHWDSASVQDLPCCTWGRNGRHSATWSHLYAVHQACRMASCVVAVLPASALEQLRATPTSLPLVGVWHLPRDIFRAEGAEVSTWVGLWSNHARPGTSIEADWTPGQVVAPVELRRFADLHEVFRLLPSGADIAPVITLPVTGDARVQVRRCGRHFRLGFACGLVQAEVMNRLLGAPLKDVEEPVQLRPNFLTYTGEGIFDLELHLIQEDPQASFDAFLAKIRDAGGNPVLVGGVQEFLTRRIRQSAAMRIPLGHVVEIPGGAQPETTGTTTAHVRLGTGFTAPVIPRGTKVLLRRGEGTTAWSVSWRGSWVALGEHQMGSFQIEGGADGWLVLHPPVSQHPQLREAARACIQRAKALGIDRWLTREYQFDDLIEIACRPGNGLIDWIMSLGKARLALALALLGGHRNLIVVQAHLVEEMTREIAKIGLAADLWQVIETPRQCRDLRKINIIAYSRLRMRVDPLAPRRQRFAYAGLLRGQCHTVVCDEVQVLSTQGSQQAQAVRYLGGTRRFGLSGTPIRNYARNLLPIMTWLYGDGTVLQPYGQRHAFLEPQNIRSLRCARRGMEAFADRFIEMEWVTNEFAETLSEGAKREVPRIRNPALFQAWIAPLHKRRVGEEPDVRKYVKVPVPTYEVHEIAWDTPHLEHYLAVSDEFAHWWRKANEDAGNKRRLNLVALLARIQAVQDAANCPQAGTSVSPGYGPLTSKDEAILDRVEAHVAGGHRCLVFFRRPMTVERHVAELTRRGIRALAYHGQIPIARRNADLYREVVHGDMPVMVATIASCQTGLNLPMLDRVLFGERSWTGSEEAQAAARVLRPQNTRDVLVEHFHLEGSIDLYQAQMVTQKLATSAQVIDHQRGPKGEFLHLDTILGRFVREIGPLAERLRARRRHGSTPALSA